MSTKTNIVGFLVGFLISIGLNISGMTQSQKVISFLDIFGKWDASLMFVMVGAIVVHATYFFLIKPKFKKPILVDSYQVSERKDITASLILGSILFGIGWGLGGYCPGPGVASLSTFSLNSIVFVVSLFIGMALYRSFGSKIPISK